MSGGFGPGELKRSRDLRGGRWSWTLKFAQKRSWVGRWSWAEQVTSFVSSCPSCSSDSATDIVLLRLSDSVQHSSCQTAIAQCTSRWAMARGHRLNTSIVLAAVHGLSGLFRTVSAVEPSLSRPLPTPVPVESLIGHLASVDVKQPKNEKVYVYAAFSGDCDRPWHFRHTDFFYWFFPFIDFCLFVCFKCLFCGGGGGGGGGGETTKLTGSTD